MKNLGIPVWLGVTLILLVGCAPASAPAPTAVKSAAAPTTAPTAPAAKASSVAKAEASPAARPAPSPSVKPAPSPAAAPFDEKAVADFYRGKTVRIVVGYGAGGGYDTYARLIAKYLGKYIPGEPTVIVENMTGAGGVLAANFVYSSGPRDGTVVGNIAGSLAFEQLFEAAGVQFDILKYRHVGVPVQENLIAVVPRGRGVASLQEMMGPVSKQLVVGGISGSTSEYGPALLRDIVGANIKLITGYAGTSAIRLAMDSGEVDGLFNVWQSLKVTNNAEIASGEWVILAQMTEKAIPDLPQKNVPTISDMAKTEEQKQVLLAGTAYPNQLGKLYVMAPETPSDRALAMNAAFQKALADRGLLADAAKSNLEITPLTGDDTMRLARGIMGLPTDMKEKLRAVLKP